MIFKKFRIDIPGLEPNAYIFACEVTRKATLIDGALFTDEMRNFLNQHELKLRKVFITHDHYDHTAAIAEAIEMHGAAVYSATGKAGGYITRQVGHGDTFRCGEVEGHVLQTPGHTQDGISLVIDPGFTPRMRPGMVFTGDALFAGSVGGTTNPLNAEKQLEAIRNCIFGLPDDYEIHPGHGPSSTVAVEREHSPFFV